MLNTKKLLYILPDSALIAELLPTKKAHSFAVQSFRQINGSFIDENEFIAENIEKLLKKIDPDEYTLVLPDFLFTNTIVDVHHTSETEVKKFLKEELLPSLNLSKETHEIDTFILTQHQGKSKVQLSALEKSLLVPLQKGADAQGITINSISPLSWTIKSVISLEPSLSTIQLGSMLYVSQHYIGIDQTISYSIEETGNIIETVKTLKGAEPNIQTMYLLTNALIENEIKEKLSGTLPIQQLASFAEDQEGMPAYVKQIIESAAKTLDLPDQPVPKFSLGKMEAEVVLADETKGEAEEESKTDMKKGKKVETPFITETVEETETVEGEIPAPTPPPQVAAAATPEPNVDSLVEDLFENSPEKESTSETSDVSVKETVSPEITESPTVVVSPPAVPLQEEPITGGASEPQQTPNAPFTVNFNSPITAAAAAVPNPASTPTLPLDTPIAGGFAMNQPTVSFADSAMSTGPAQPQQNTYPIGQNNQPGIPNRRPVIKNKNDAGALFKVVLITLGALIATVGIGVGIGLGVLKLSENNANSLDQNPAVQATPSAQAAAPSPSPLPSPSPTAAIAKDKTRVLVVNATTISGKAGKVKKSLTDAGYKTVDTGNAKGEYQTPGTYLLTTTDNPALLSQLTTDSGLTLSSSTADKAIEDPKSAYDAVIVLAE
jgi:hypothetical protein